MDPDERSKNSHPRPEPEPPDTQRAQRFWLESSGRTFELRLGEVQIGRSSGCQMVLDDALVSRRHAQIIVLDDRTLVEDFGSANGVFVNGQRVSGKQPLKAGDALQIGKQQFVLRSAARTAALRDSERSSAETLHGLRIAPDMSAAIAAGTDYYSALDPKSEARPAREVESTHRAEALELLGGVADKALALGRGEEAERVLDAALGSVLSQAKRGRDLSPRVVARAATYAGKLAEATAHGKWLDYAIELYFTLHRPMPIDMVDHMYGVLRRVSGVNLPTLRAYLSLLQAQAATYGPNERFAIQRLEGFERLAALK